MTTETHAIPCRCGATLTEETYDLHMHANHRTPERMHEDQERAAEARHGGRYISEQLGDRFGEDAKSLRKMQDTGDPSKVSQYWAYALSPSGSVYPSSGRETTARSAQEAARIGGVTWEHSAYWRAPTLPESAFDWPIYRAGMGDAQALLDALVETEGATIEDANRIDDCIRALRVIPGVAF